MNFGVTVKAQRKFLQLTQRELALLAGVTEKTLSQIERGNSGVQLSSLLKVLSALGLELSITEESASHNLKVG